MARTPKPKPHRRAATKDTVVTTTVPRGDGGTLGSVLGGLAKGVLDSSLGHQMVHAGATSGERRAAARLTARATVYAALLATGRETRAKNLDEAVAVVADLETRDRPVAVDARGMSAKEAGAMIDHYDAAYDALRSVIRDSGKEGGVSTERAQSVTHDHELARAALRTALMGNHAGFDAFGFPHNPIRSGP